MTTASYQSDPPASVQAPSRPSAIPLDYHIPRPIPKPRFVVIRTPSRALLFARLAVILAAVVIFALGMGQDTHNRREYQIALLITLNLYVVIAAISAAGRWYVAVALALVGIIVAFFYLVTIESAYSNSTGPHGFDGCTWASMAGITGGFAWVWWLLSRAGWPREIIDHDESRDDLGILVAPPHRPEAAAFHTKPTPSDTASEPSPKTAADRH